ncbi:MAG: hypothetical protein L0228_05230 [Planctomycetes bacterium]|nr:hypothetical protein [Planctomycetota bacterium]
MSTDATPELEERTKWSPWALVAAAFLLLMFCVIGVGLLRGYLSQDPQQAAKSEEEKKKKEKDEKEKEKKKDVDILFPVVQPSEPEAPLQYAKPGHWATATQTMRANYRDFVGDSRTSITDGKRVPYPIANTPFVLRASRPVFLTKGQPKAPESTLFLPQTNQKIGLAIGLEERGMSVPLPTLETSITAMPSYQYHFVVLAKEPSRYTFLKTLDSVSVPFGGETDYDKIERTVHYRVVTMDVRKEVALSDNPLTWTSIAYIVWDEVDPQIFSPEQEGALVDWIHWGGQLIISGPDSIDSLKDSFLAPYLPADSGGARTISAGDAALKELNREGNDGWLISTLVTPGEPLEPKAPWSGIKLDVRPDTSAQAIPNTGGLIVERPVGRGRIVMTAMQLSERELINWRTGFESLFNGALLRRPGREYRPGSLGPVTVMWRDPQYSNQRLDARLTTKLNYFARDLGVDTSYRLQEVRDQFNQFGQQEVINQYTAPAAVGGIGAWNDFSATADAAREALREAAGVDVPGAGFVVLCLAVYLVALVPLNWLIFQTVGRVEWAWIAAPLIAIVGTFVVVNQAQLDIGFVRAQTEIGVLEQQPNYARAHLSRYTALYTSLSTTYDLEFPNLTSLAAPFPATSDFRMLRGQGLQNVDFERYDNVRLAGLPISSNSTGMVHSEQMFALDGAIQKGKSKATGGNQIENHTKYELSSACLVRRNGEELEGMWIGQMLPGKAVSLSFKKIDAKQPAFVTDRAAEERVQRTERLNLEPMFRLALDPKHIDNGETRLVARVDEVLPGQTITPAASQVRGATLVVAHLEYAKLPKPGKDRNTRRDIKADAPNNNEIDFESEAEP